MKYCLQFFIFSFLLVIFSFSDLFSSQIPLKKDNTSSLKNDIVSETVLDEQRSDQFKDDDIKKYLDENGRPLFERNIKNFKTNDSAEGDSFQEYPFTGAAATDYFGFSVASAGDVNGDGFADIIVGAPFNDAGGNDAGRAYIYFGSYVIDYTADVILTGTAAGSKAGYSVASAGDVNRDGYADVIIGAIGYNSNNGRALIYFGGSSMNNVADVILDGQGAGELFGYSVASAGDVNRDGFSDVVVGAYAYSGYDGRAYAFFGGAGMDNTADLIFSSGDPGSAFGNSVASAGDVNSDGYRDIIISELLGPSSYGKAFIFFGGVSMDNIADVTMTGSTPADYFGSSVSSAGDMNGDGFDDVIIGAYYFNAQTGAAYIFYGGAAMNNVSDVTLNGTAFSNIFGASVAGAGDVNGDGFKDVIVGARLNTNSGGSNAGCAFVYYGGSTVNNVPDAVFNGSNASDQFGFSVANAGDVNKDGYSDLIIGTPYNDQAGNDAGKTWLYTNTRNYTATPLASFSGPGGNDYYGLASKTAGDLNGDGYSDVMVTSINNQLVYIYYGGKLMDNNVDLIIYSVYPGSASFGKSISTAGDLNGDGYSDIIIGAEESAPNNVGMAAIYFGGANMDIYPDLFLIGQSSNAYFGSSVSYAGDVNNDNYDDVIVGARSAGKAYVFFGGPSMDNIADVTMTGTALFGYSVTDAGDINGDNYDDVAVSAYLDLNSVGRVFIYYGGASMDNIADKILTGLGLNNKFGQGIVNAGDVNADGFPDLLVLESVPGFLPIDSRGMVQVFYGGVSMDTIPDLTMIGLDQNYNLGVSMSTAGDYNRDGYTDFLLSSGNAKRVYFYFGGPNVDNIYDYVIAGEKVNTNIYFGMSASYAGDVNGDGAPDIIAGGYNINLPGNAYIFTYSNTNIDITDEGFLGAGAGDWFGYSVASAGDVNADGYSDVIIGARLNDAVSADAGRAYIYFGGNPMDYNPDVVLNGVSPGDNFGFSVASAGDVNADNYDDVIVGAPLNDAGGFDAGRAYIFYGGAVMNNVADVILTGQASGDYFGWRVASAGNFNGDNFGDIWDDVIVGAPYNDAGGSDAGRVYVYFGDYTMNNAVDVILTGEAAGDIFGVSVASAGNVNGDSFGDIIVGASRNDFSAADGGRAYIYYGAMLPANTPAVYLNGYQVGAGDSYGYSVASAGDMNGDTYGDVIVGAYSNNQAGNDAGRAYLYYGGASMDANADMNYYGENANDNFGICVASAGDVNSDGYSDLIIGAVFNDAGGTDAGRAYVYFGRPEINNAADIILTGKSQDYFGWFVANAGDVNGDGLSDPVVGAYKNSQVLTEAGKGFLYLSSYPANHCELTLKMILQGYYNNVSKTMLSSDTVRINLRSTAFPYIIVDQAKSVVSKVNFTSKFYFNNAPSGNYYIEIIHRNSIKTWSAQPLNFVRNINTNYDMTTGLTKAFGNNLKQVDSSPLRFGVYSADKNLDGVVNSGDVLDIYNDMSNFVSGYVNSDVNGDYQVDFSDVILAMNNSNSFVAVIAP
ncbi:MAG TPA: FG-GAP-like repeat-containing protein [Ignavibacteria bacterium]|nr:FG-GAP-like repeat-containing protein [Ignavibacteria bacterium]HMR40621.1 FG-GAP-like repeat-containing protein [Ignavibacteria bacterium]